MLSEKAAQQLWRKKIARLIAVLSLLVVFISKYSSNRLAAMPIEFKNISYYNEKLKYLKFNWLFEVNK